MDRMDRWIPHAALGFALLCNAAANILIKYSMSRAAGDGAKGIAVFLQPIYLLALALFGVNLVAYSWALKTFKISAAYPVMVSGGYLLILLAGWFLFGERLSSVQYAGVGLILAGIWFVVR